MDYEITLTVKGPNGTSQKTETFWIDYWKDPFRSEGQFRDAGLILVNKFVDEEFYSPRQKRQGLYSEEVF